VLGIGMSLGVQSGGYDVIVQRSGYVYADAFSRDQDAWKLAVSGRPIWSSFQQDFLSDQWRLAGAERAGLPRPQPGCSAVLDPDLPAFAQPGCLLEGSQERWNEPLAGLAAWLLVLYPESLLVGASQMREPFLLGLTMIAFWAVFAWRKQPRRAAAAFAAACLVMLAFSSRAAVVVIGALLVCAWIEYLDDITTRRWKWLGWAVLGLAVVVLVGLSWSWLKLATAYDAGLAVRQRGMVQKNLIRTLKPARAVYHRLRAGPPCCRRCWWTRHR
jgi:hypothetical protein